MSELAAFVLAQIEADEAAARELVADLEKIGGGAGAEWHASAGRLYVGQAVSVFDSKPAFVEFVARHDPARVLADCEAKKAIVAECYVADCIEDDLGTVMDRRRVTPYVGERILLALARPFAGREGWRDEWGTNTQEAQT